MQFCPARATQAIERACLAVTQTCLDQTMVNEHGLRARTTRRDAIRDDKAKDPPLQLSAAVIGKGKKQEQWQGKEQGKTRMPPLVAAGTGNPTENDNLMSKRRGRVEFCPARATQAVEQACLAVTQTCLDQTR